MKGLLEGKVALVTGGGSGIGQGAALRFSAEGARVAVADMNLAGAKETVARIVERGGEAAAFECDVAEEVAVAALIEGVVARFGGLHCAHNNAGLGHGQVPLHEIDKAAWDRTFAVNVTGTWLCLKYEIKHMLASDGGAIVCTSSISSLCGLELIAGYAASKAAINSMVRTAANAYGKQGIRVNAILPGPIGTSMITQAIKVNPALEKHLMEAVPMERIGAVEEVAEAVVWLCSERTAYITGTLLPIDGGQSTR